MRDVGLSDRMEELGLLAVARYVARGLSGDPSAWSENPCKGHCLRGHLFPGPQAPHNRDCPIARFDEQFGDPQRTIDLAHDFASWMARIDRKPDGELFGTVEQVRVMMRNIIIAPESTVAAGNGPKSHERTQTDE